MNINLELLKVSKMTSLKIENLYITTQVEARNIKFGQQVNIIEKVLLSTPLQEVLMSLAYNHVTNLFILRATVIKFGQKKQLRHRIR